LKYAEIKRFDVANSPQIGSTLFVSGCNFKCKGCFNEIAQDFNYGYDWTSEIENKFIEYLKHPQVKHANLLGGEIMQQDSEIILSLVKRIKAETTIDIWTWTGCLFEDLIKEEDKLQILKYIDILIDGQFKLENKDLMLKYKGSSNQRIIDVQESIKQNKVILYME
jgi:anaerobic ribonucleoside-triphosphate reductase activating protein